MYQNLKEKYVEVRVCRKEGCEKLFVPHKSNQFYCCHEHYAENYVKIVKKESKYPLWKCPECGNTVELDYFPKSSPKKFSKQKCIECGYCVKSDYEEILALKKLFAKDGDEGVDS